MVGSPELQRRGSEPGGTLLSRLAVGGVERASLLARMQMLLTLRSQCLASAAVTLVAPGVFLLRPPGGQGAAGEGREDQKKHLRV